MVHFWCMCMRNNLDDGLNKVQSQGLAQKDGEIRAWVGTGLLGEVDSAYEVRAMAERSRSTGTSSLLALLATNGGDYMLVVLRAFFLNFLAVSSSSSVRLPLDLSKTGFLSSRAVYIFV